MATYFHGNNTSEIQSSAEGLQTLYLMNPNYVPFSDSAQNPTPNMLFLNPNTGASTSANSGHALNLASLSHAPPQHHQQQQQHLIGVTIPASNMLGTANGDEISGFHAFATTAAAPRVHYNLWGSIIDPTPSSAAAAAAAAVAAAPSGNSGHAATVTATAEAETGFHRPGHQQGLSLSLSSQQPPYRSFSGEVDGVSPASRGVGGGDLRVVGNNGVLNMHSAVLGSKYLKAAQELLDEVVNVGKGISIREGASNNKEKMKGNIVESTSGVGDGSSGGGENSGASKQGGELSTAQRQELQMKKSKLVTMLDEVEQRYRQYHHQMQIVISSFEQAAGYGAARSYAALALKTISKQFRCLKDAISSQIRATSKTLGEDDCLGAKVEGSRLRYVDHHLRQQRALQQLGMIQHNAWRPQRGLPERAVSILRAWLFEHFLHPYPKDSDKVMLAKQTGLTRGQVSNWFINARVRLWKPMVEEMYLEEIKDQEQNNGSQDDTNRPKESNKELWSSSASNAAQEPGGAIRLDQINVFQSKAESFNNQNTSPTEISNSNNNNSMSASPMGASLQSHSGNFLLAGSNSDMQRSPNKPRNSHELHNSPGSILSVDMEMKPIGEINREANHNTKFGIERHPNNKDGYPLMAGNENHGGGGYGAFSMEDIGRFNVTDHHRHHHHHHQQLTPRFHGNGVSLTLGLPPSENNLPTLSGTQHGFLSQNMHMGGRLEMGTNDNNEFCAINSTTPSSHSGTSYDNLDMQSRKRFATQLLRDFVA